MRLSSPKTRIFRFIAVWISPILVIICSYSMPNGTWLIPISLYSLMYIFLLMPTIGHLCEVYGYDTHIKIVMNSKEVIVPKSEISSLFQGFSSMYTIHLKDGKKYYFMATIMTDERERKEKDFFVRNYF